MRKFGRPYTPPSNLPIKPWINMSKTPRDTVADLSAERYYKRLARLMGRNPPLRADSAVIATFARIGLVPGKPYDLDRLPRRTRLALIAAADAAKPIIKDAAQQLNLTPTNWSMSLDLGGYGTDYLERAAVAYSGLGANLYLDAVYAGVFLDEQGSDLSGSNRYHLSFAPNQFPPSNPDAFWSVTLYNRPDETLFSNSIGRNALGIPAAQGHLPCLNDDGSLDILVQATAPGPKGSQAYCNWLPAPAGEFILLLRIYWPGNKLFRKTNPWIPPAVAKVN